MTEAALLTAAQRLLLASALDRILPAGDGRPSARELGVMDGADWLLRQPDLAPTLPVLRAGLTLLDAASLSTTGRSFIEADATQQDAALLAIQNAPHPTVQRFMTLLVRLALTGALGEPALGGNRDGAGWRYIGYEPTSRATGPRPAAR